jgi:penicillin amidase
MVHGRAVLSVLLVVALATPAAAISVTLRRDRWGVPHLFVPDEGTRVEQLRALGFALGYVQAQDRMFQLELSRRIARGRFAELSPPYFPGSAVLAQDIRLRREGLTDDERRAAVRRLPGRLRVVYEAHAEGVNRFLDEVRPLPFGGPQEFLVIPPVERWDVIDTAAIAEGSRTFYEFGGYEIFNAVLLLDLLDRFPEAEARGIFGDLYWLEDPTAPTTIAEGRFRGPRMTPFAPRQMALVRRHAAAIRAAAAVVTAEEGGLGAVAPTSNAMVIGGDLTASGHPILLGGPQTGLTLPNLWYQVGLHGGGYEAQLVMSPSLSAIGRTASTAWTLTSTITDTADVYIEELNPENPRQYRFRGRFRDMECRSEAFMVAGQPVEPRELCRTIHGPVFASFPDMGVAFSRHSHVVGRELATSATQFGLGFARTLRAFRRTANGVGMSGNVMYADARGNIGYFTRGARPRRHRGFDPRLPLPGTGEAEPEEPLRGGRLPTTINPRSDYIAQWNNKPVRGWSTDELRELWGGVDRVQVLIDQIEAARAGGRRLTADDVAEFMRRGAVTDFLAPRVFPFLRAAVDALDPSVPDRAALVAAADLVARWLAEGGSLVADGTGTIPYPGLTIYRAWRVRVQAETFADELGRHARTPYYFQHAVQWNQDDSGSLFSPDALFVRALEGPGAAFPTSRDYFANVMTGTRPGRDATLVGALRTTLAALVERFASSDMTTWLTPRLTVQFLANSAAEVNYGPTIMERQNRGSVNLLVELGPSPTARVVVPPGNSAHITFGAPEPAHLRDQLALFEAFGWHTMPVAADELEGPFMEVTIDVP